MRNSQFGLSRYSKEDTFFKSYNYQPRQETSETGNLNPDAKSEKWSAAYTLKIQSHLHATKHWVDHFGYCGIISKHSVQPHILMLHVGWNTVVFHCWLELMVYYSEGQTRQDSA